METLGVVAGGHQKRAAVSGPMPKRAIRSGAVASSRDSIFSFSSVISVSNAWMRWANDDE